MREEKYEKLLTVLTDKRFELFTAEYHCKESARIHLGRPFNSSFTSLIVACSQLVIG